MSEILVEDDTSYPASVTVPEDGDARNAASVVVGFQALANRFAYLMAKLLGALLYGGNWLLAGGTSGLTIDLSGGALKFVGNDDYNIHLGGISGSPGGVKLFANGLMRSHLFVPGADGRAPRKPLFNNSASSQTINPILYDCFIFTPSGAGQVLTTTTQTYVEGDWFEVSNQSTTDTMQIDAGGVITTVAVKSGSIPGLACMVYASGNWRRVR